MGETRTDERTGAAPAARMIPFPLLHPTIDGSTITLEHRTPSGRDMRRAMSQAGMARYTTLIGDVFEVDEATLDKLDGRDYMRLVKWADSFFDPHQET